jgi:hypothetical protein
LGHTAEDSLALEGWQPAGGSESFDGGGDGKVGVFAPGLDYAGDHRAIEGGADFDEIAVFDPPAIDKETVSCDWGDG